MIPAGLGRVLSLTKPRIVGLLCLTGVSAVVAAGGLPATELVAFVVAGAAIAAGSASFNCWYDRDIDRVMDRTADRPLPSGALPAWVALTEAGVFLAVGTVVALATLPLLSVAYMWLGVAAYVGLYTVGLKRRHWLGVVLGGSAGAFPVLAGWTAVRPLTLEPVGMAALVMAWTPAHAWALALVYRTDFERAAIPTLPVVTGRDRVSAAVWVSAIATVAVTGAIAITAGPFYAVVAATASACYLASYWRFRDDPSDPNAVGSFFTSNAFLAVVFVGWAVATHVQSTVLTGSLAILVTVGLFRWLWRREPSLNGVTAPADIGFTARRDGTPTNS